jgi:4-hydroxy-4-methyl-2-oxoglutarate aldolase
MRLLSLAELATWQGIPTAVVSDERQHQGVLSAIRPLFPGRSFVAQALTIEVEAIVNDAPRKALAEAWPRACIAIDARRAADAAVWGGNLARMARERGVAAVVVDGRVRDTVDLRDSGLAVCSRGVTPRGPLWGGRIGGTILCGGVEIRAGDLLVGDDDGVVAVPLDVANDDLLTRCRARVARDAPGTTA